MAQIKPIRAWRYNENLEYSIEKLTSPLFDVVSQKQLHNLYKLPYNSIHLSVPQGPNPARNASGILKKWKDEKILVQDDLPSIYVYYQYFKLPEREEITCRKGFVSNIRIYNWDEEVLLRHENTISHAVSDRIELIEETQLNVSPTHGLYTDPEFILEKYMDEAISSPIYETEDYQGVRDVLGIIQDYEVINKFIEVIKDKQIILADGHHRYEGSLHYMNKMKETDPEYTKEKGYNFHMMYLTNSESRDLRILPTHRVINNMPDFDEEKILKLFEENFTIKPVENAFEVQDIILGKKWAFGLLFKENAYKVRLKPEKIQLNPWPFPNMIKDLDITVMHYFIIEDILGIKGKDQRKSDKINFDRSFADCMAKTIRGEAQMALIANEISMEQVKQVCYSGFTMPQKSTFFYPKVICGFLFSSTSEDEFSLSDYPGF